MNIGSHPLLDCANGAFDFADVCVVGGKIETDGKEVVFQTLESHVRENLDDLETTAVVEADGQLHLCKNGFALDVGDVHYRPELKLARHGVEKPVSLYVKNVDTKRDFAMIDKDESRCRKWMESGDMIGRGALRRLSHEAPRVRPVYHECPTRIINGDRAVQKEVVSKDAFKLHLRGVSKVAVQRPGRISSCYFTPVKTTFVARHGSYEGVAGNF